LADGDGLAHLLLGKPFLAVDELALHLADQGDWPAEAEKAQSWEIAHQLAHVSALGIRRCRRHRLSPSP
jgi:hypothetical protein